MCFHGVEYSVNIWVQRDELHVQVEEQSLKLGLENDRWGAHFPSLYIEELTKKTGNFKRFHTFVNMLISALNHKSESVFIDLLTYSDLELYRKRKMGKSAPMHQAESTSSMHNNKRYLILTYAVEFDRVHYPLPLSFIANPSPDMLKKTIKRLKQALLDTKSENSPQLDKQLASMQEENDSLRLRLQQLQDMRDYQDDNASLARLKNELQSSITENKELMALYQQLRKESSKEIQSLQTEVDRLRSKPDEVFDDSRYIQRIRQLEKDFDRYKADQNRHKLALEEQLDEATKELTSAKSTIQELQLKNRELLRQLAIQRTKSTPSTHIRSTPHSTPVRFRLLAHLTCLKKRRSSEPPSSDSEDGSVKKKFSQSDKTPPRFKRFDPTAYHQERQQKLRARSQSPKPPSPARKPPQSNGYSSDSSAGYRSGGSDYTRRSRAPRNSSSQRENDARLGSPRQPRQARQREAETRYRSPSRIHDEPKDTRCTPPRGRPKPSKQAMKRLSLDDSESDTPLQSFVDIDNRLNALQQFLKDAKQPKKDH
ncbi:hypothetical protein AeMF1_002876 [Aphanomyces euteiches]|nr:hypothetical protein AeMF1_020199 [Aphanomyces euteiches]KAH9117731.1 hypothetical protein AeMF1_008738 [Aphanomyces euteiches]KAH9122003.1 hypothetical protein AeMF1_006526 [Aphanomyces euteiches]KAH9125503.1 hypothetical protein AeMF1_003900 [Aphanomyces euteiches]KAH9126452.1 hypothetical protein AeMF1_003139 [Aphanomyces euteiches]